MDRVTGALRIAGNAGGLFHLRDGVVVAVDSPGSPGVDTLLLSSDRIRQKDWTAALTESVETKSLQAALAARGITPTEIQDIATAVLYDGAFAAAAGEIERYNVEESIDPPLLPTSEGIAPDALLAETARRLDALLPFCLSPYRDRVASCSTEPDCSTAAQREIIALATGRRNARDIAFALGRSLYPITIEISRMLDDGLLAIAPPATAFSFSRWGPASVRPRSAAGQITSVDQPNSLPSRRPAVGHAGFRNRLSPSEVEC